MKLIVVVLVSFLPETGQCEMFNYRDLHFSSQTACELFVMDNKQFLADEANRAYLRNSKDYMIRCPRLDKFEANVADEETHNA